MATCQTLKGRRSVLNRKEMGKIKTFRDRKGIQLWSCGCIWSIDKTDQLTLSRMRETDVYLRVMPRKRNLDEYKMKYLARIKENKK